MKRITSAAVILLNLVMTQTLYAADVLAQFNTTISKLEISKDAGTTYITVFEGNTAPVDLVTLSGSGVGTFLGQAQVPAGTYNRARVTISTATLVFTVDGSGLSSGGTNLSAGTTGTLTVNLTTLAGAPRFPLVREISINNITCSSGGSVTSVIDFDAQTSFSGLTYVDADGVGAGTSVTLTALSFDPVIQVG